MGEGTKDDRDELLTACHTIPAAWIYDCFAGRLALRSLSPSYATKTP
jgi:hypothetical protein